MRTPLVVGVLIFAVTVTAAVVGIPFVFGDPIVPDQPDDGARSLTELWVSETIREVQGNHHAVVVGRVANQSLVFAPISGTGHHHDSGTSTDHDHDDNSSECALVALNGTDGATRWSHRVPAANCTIHSIADPTFADIDGDGSPEVVAATTENVVKAFDPMTGAVTFRYNLSSYGYTKPMVANVTGDETPELIVVDVKGSVFVVRPDGTTVWQDLHRSYTWGQPAVGAFTSTDRTELFVALGNGRLMLYDATDGSVRWNRTLRGGGSITWTTSGQADSDTAREIVVSTTRGLVRLYDGGTGALQWSQDLGRFAAVDAFGDGDGDGTAEIYAVANDGTVRSLTAATGQVEWQRNVTATPVQMMPPPVLGDLTGDGTPELVVAANSGRVAVLDPTNGTVLAAYDRDVPIWTHPALADTDGDDGLEIVVMYGNGEVVALEYRQG